MADRSRRGTQAIQGVTVLAMRYLAQIAYAGVLLGLEACILERRERHHGQQRDDRDHDHDFHEGERRLPLGSLLHGAMTKQMAFQLAPGNPSMPYAAAVDTCPEFGLSL